MEKPLIVLVDAENQCVHLYGEFDKTIAFEDIFTLNCYLEGRKVFYIEQMSETDGAEVTSLVDQLRDPDAVVEPRYIRCLLEGYVRIPELKLVLAGQKDSKPIVNYGFDLFEKSPTLKKYLLQGQVEIISESKAKELKKARPDPKARDKQYDAILCNKPVDQVLEENSMFGSDAEVDEITDDTEVISEAEAIIKNHKIGKQV